MREGVVFLSWAESEIGPEWFVCMCRPGRCIDLKMSSRVLGIGVVGALDLDNGLCFLSCLFPT